MSLSGQRVLLSGACGYLGSAVTTALASQNCILSRILHRSPEGDCRNEAVFHRCFHSVAELAQAQFDIFIHCATCYGRAEESDATLRRSNVRFPLGILEQIYSESLFFLNFDTSLPADISSYAKTKQEFVEAAQARFPQLRFLNVKLEQFYGPGDNSIISRLINSLRNNTPLPLTKGEQERDFIYIADVVSAVELLLKEMEPKQGGMLEVPLGSGKALSLRAIADAILSLGLGNEHCLQWGAIPYRANEVFYSRADLSYLNSRGWQPQFDLAAGLREMLAR